jgi:Family of unknown function (DUF5522)
MKEQSDENRLVEGEDFYFTPEGYKCFTEKHHLKRGYCCKSGCRHCPFVKELTPKGKKRRDYD